MVNVSKKYLEKDFKSLIWRAFKAEIVKTKSEDELKKALDRYLTPAEQVMLEKRLAILEMLKNKSSYRRIKETLDVSHDTISFVKNGFSKTKKLAPKKHWQHPMLEKLQYRKSPSKFPAYKYRPGKGRGRWKFLNV
jgi:uncharacterized protein YerC